MKSNARQYNKIAPIQINDTHQTNQTIKSMEIDINRWKPNNFHKTNELNENPLRTMRTYSNQQKGDNLK